MREKLMLHRRIEAENREKLILWKMFGTCKINECLLNQLRCNGYDDGILAYT